MPQTLSVIKADVGGYVGHTAMHPELLEDRGANRSRRQCSRGC